MVVKWIIMLIHLLEHYKFINILYKNGAVTGFIASLDNETLYFTLIQDEQYIKNYKYVDIEETTTQPFEIL